MNEKVKVSRLVSNENCGNLMFTVLGRFSIAAERFVFDWAGRLSKNYQGGAWQGVSLNNGGFYLVPHMSQQQVKVDWALNYFDGSMTEDAFGIVVCLFALCALAERYPDDRIINSYHALRDYAVIHPEARMILRAID